MKAKGHKNKRVKNQALFQSNNWVGYAFVIIVVILFGGISVWSLQAKCDKIRAKIAHAEKRLAQQDSEYEREATRLEEMVTPEKLAEKLIRFGLEMNYARADQVVRMTAHGHPAPGQISVARALQRARTDAMAYQDVSTPSPLRMGRLTTKRRSVRR